jgi:hypothetical protein
MVAAMRRPWRIDLLAGVAQADLDQARKDAASSEAGKLPALDRTESEPKWVLLYNDARVKQLHPKTMRRLRREDLEYLAGMDFPHPDLTAPKQPGEANEDVARRHSELTKLQGNVARAKSELGRRNLIWATLITSIAALGGAVIGVLLTR